MTIPTLQSITSPQHVVEIEQLRSQLARHALYSSMLTVEDVRVYMEFHVWCVWDFMALLKSLQANFLCSSPAWMPPHDPVAGHLIYEMLGSEETDIDESGGSRSSHFDTYLRAMSQAGASRTTIDVFVMALRNGASINEALALADPPAACIEFVDVTLRIARGPVHGAVAALYLSREQIIPPMFDAILARLAVREHLTIFEWYLRRHITLDSEQHGPLSARLMDHVVGDDSQRLAECIAVARDALLARVRLLDRILDALRNRTT